MYYIAVLAPTEINDKVLEWKEYMRDRYMCSVALKSPAHLTLITPFWMNEEQQDKLEKELLEFSLDQKSFEIDVSDFNCFAPRVIYLDVTSSVALISLQNNLETLLSQSFPIKTSGNDFHPHITIATRDLQKKDFREAWAYFQGKKYRANFEVTHLTLLRHNGRVWEPVYAAPLTG